MPQIAGDDAAELASVPDEEAVLVSTARAVSPPKRTVSGLRLDPPVQRSHEFIEEAVPDGVAGSRDRAHFEALRLKLFGGF